LIRIMGGDEATTAENCIDPELEVRLCGSDRFDRLPHAVGTDTFRMTMTNPIRAQNNSGDQCVAAVPHLKKSRQIRFGDPPT
jgi:hypothetical protein